MKTLAANRYVPVSPCAVALGSFDGVHPGHAAVIGAAREAARTDGFSCVVWTFDALPKNALGAPGVPIITGAEEKRRLLRALGVDYLLIAEFDEALRSLSPERFIDEVLIAGLRARHVACGWNYTFGDRAAGTPALLRELCAARGIGVTVVPPVEIDGAAVSSSAIRAAVQNGDVAGAARLLGRPFAIHTLVIAGQQLARRLGFPTVNQVFEPGILVPQNGVYLTRVRLPGRQRADYGITDVGTRPTVGGTTLCAETHIFDYTGNLYGKKVRVEFLERLRPELKFASVEALSRQVHSDIETARERLAAR